MNNAHIFFFKNLNAREHTNTAPVKSHEKKKISRARNKYIKEANKNPVCLIERVISK